MKNFSKIRKTSLFFSRIFVRTINSNDIPNRVVIFKKTLPKFIKGFTPTPLNIKGVSSQSERGFTPTPFKTEGVSSQSEQGFTPTPLNIKGVSSQSERGFMTVEVLIGISIITISILASMAVVQKSIHVSRQAFHFTQANFLLEEGAEVIRINRDDDWNNISSLTIGTDYYPLFSSGSWNLSTTPNTVGIFTRTISIVNVKRDDTTKDISSTGTVDNGTKLVTVTVSWIEGGTTISKSLSFYILDIFS